MGIFLTPRGRAEAVTPREACDRALAWFERNERDRVMSLESNDDGGGSASLFVVLHPAADAVRITWSAQGDVEADAKTSPVGPGYHAYLCEVLDRLARDLRIEWDRDDEETDVSGFFATRDRSALDAEMFGWAAGVARTCLERLEEKANSVAISMPLSPMPVGDETAVLTLLGPRRREWFEAAVADARVARELFPWWGAGFDAHYWLGRALVLMWNEVCWRSPLDDGESNQIDDVLGMLERAHRLDGSIAMPSREWAELLRLRGKDEQADAIERRADSASEGAGRIGYRRAEVIHRLAGRWSVRMPGSFREAQTDEGGFVASDPNSTIWITTISFAAKPGATLTAESSLPRKRFEGDPVELAGLDPSLARHAAVARIDDGTDMTLRAAVASPGAIAVVTVEFDASHPLANVTRLVEGLRYHPPVGKE